MKFKTLFMSDEEKHAIILICRSFYYAQVIPAPGGLSAECVEISGASRD